MTTPRLLFIGHYPLDVLDRAPKVRIAQLAKALAKRVDVTLVSAIRSERRHRLATLLSAVTSHQFDAVYVESASSTATWADLRFMRAVRRSGVPLGIFVRDAYQLFPDLYPQSGFKNGALTLLYRYTLSQYRTLATTLFLPSAGLASAIGAASFVLLPPGAEVREVSFKPRLRRMIYVGASGRHDGVDRLLKAMPMVRQWVPDAELLVVTRREKESLLARMAIPPGVTMMEATAEALPALYEKSQCAVIPRPDTRYNRLAIPVKFFEYLSYGCPVVVTAPSELADIVRSHRLGWVADGTATGLEKSLIKALTYDGPALPLSEFVEANSWDVRAETILTTLLGSHPDH